MNKLIVIISFALLMSCNSGESKPAEPTITDIENSTLDRENPYFKMFTNFMLFDETHLFRGINLNMTIEEVRQIENIYPVSSELQSDKSNELYYEVKLSNEPLDFVDVRYTFHEGKLTFIGTEGYCSDEKKSKSMYNNLEKHFTNTLGEGQYADDGFLEFNMKNGDQNILVAIKEVNFPPAGTDDGSYGFFLLYSL